MSEVKNRRENLYVNEIPPEVLTADDVEDVALDAVSDAGYLTEETAATAGFVKNTDYAAANKGGVIKTSVNYGSAITASGGLMGISKTLEDYGSADNRMIISRGTLENVIQALVKRELIALLGGVDADVTGTLLSSWFAERTADGWNISAAKSTPTP